MNEQEILTAKLLADGSVTSAREALKGAELSKTLSEQTNSLAQEVFQELWDTKEALDPLANQMEGLHASVSALVDQLIDTRTFNLKGQSADIIRNVIEYQETLSCLIPTAMILDQFDVESFKVDTVLSLGDCITQFRHTLSLIAQYNATFKQTVNSFTLLEEAKQEQLAERLRTDFCDTLSRAVKHAPITAKYLLGDNGGLLFFGITQKKVNISEHCNYHPEAHYADFSKYIDSMALLGAMMDDLQSWFGKRYIERLHDETVGDSTDSLSAEIVHFHLKIKALPKNTVKQLRENFYSILEQAIYIFIEDDQFKDLRHDAFCSNDVLEEYIREKIPDAMKLFLVNQDCQRLPNEAEIMEPSNAFTAIST